MKTLIDTDVLSEIRKPDGHPGVKAHVARIEPHDLFVSVISIGEITFGVARLPASAKRRELEAWLSVTERYFADRILTIDRDIAQRWGEIAAKASLTGKMLHAADGLIAATALHHGLRVLTRNVVDYHATGVLLTNPWEG